MSVRAKFKCDSIERTKYRDGDEMQTVKFSPVYSDDENSENRRFWKWTPSGTISLGTINKKAGDYFELGEEYYIDFTKA